MGAKLDLPRALEKAERRVEELKIMQRIAEIDAMLARLKFYLPPKADDELPCAVDKPPLSS